MTARSIYNTSGEYVAFLLDDNVFTPDSEWLGVITSDHSVYNIDGLYIGILLDDGRIARDLRALPVHWIPVPPMPVRPVPPDPPLRGINMPDLMHPYEDVFQYTSHLTALVPAHELRSYDHLLNASIVAADGTYLGLISKDPFLADSISNCSGPYGSPFSETSIFYACGPFGGPHNPLSPFNRYSSTPPTVESGTQFLGLLTANQSLPNAINVNAFVTWLGSS